MKATHALYNVDPLAITICKRGANRQRIFLKKAADDDELLTLPASHGIMKSGDDWRVFYCVVAEPGAEEDCGQGDGAGTDIVDVWKSEDEIASAAHRFLKNKAYVNLAHSLEAEEGCTVVENAIALTDIQIGPDTIKKGSWYVAIEPNDDVRGQIDSGDFTGVSIEGTGFREAIEKAMPNYSHRAKQAKRLKSQGHTHAQIAEKMGITVDAVKQHLSKASASPDVKIPNKPGKTNWLERRGGFPRYMRKVIEDILGGNPQYLANAAGVSRAIALGVGAVKNWKDGHDGRGNKVSAKTVAKAKAAWAEWEKKKGASDVKKSLADIDPEELASVSVSLLKQMERDDEEAVGLFKRLGGLLGIGDDEMAVIEKSDTFASCMAARELDDELPQAFDVLRSVVWRAYSPYNDNAPADPAAVIAQSLDEFKAWCLDLLERISGDSSGDSADSNAQAVAKALGINPDSLPDEGATLESEMDTATADKLAKAVEDNSAATTKLIDLVEKLVTRKPESDDEGDAGGKKKTVAKSDDEPSLSDLKKSIDNFISETNDRLGDLGDSIESLADSGSVQTDNGGQRVEKSSNPLAGILD